MDMRMRSERELNQSEFYVSLCRKAFYFLQAAGYSEFAVTENALASGVIVLAAKSSGGTRSIEVHFEFLGASVNVFLRDHSLARERRYAFDLLRRVYNQRMTAANDRFEGLRIGVNEWFELRAIRIGVLLEIYADDFIRGGEEVMTVLEKERKRASDAQRNWKVE